MATSTSEILIFDTKLKEERDYWINKLNRLVEPAALTPDYNRPLDFTPRIASITLDVPEPLCLKMDKLTANSPFLIYTAMMAALKVCLYKYTRNRTVTIGSPALKDSDGHKHRANALVIVDGLDDHLLFRNVLMNTRETLLEAYSRHRYPFNRLLKDLGLEEPKNRCPLFDVAFAFEDIHGAMPEVRNDINIVTRRAAGGISCVVEFKDELFKPGTIERFASHFINILKQGLETPDRLIGGFDLLSGAEREKILIEWNRTGRDYCGESGVHRLFEAQVDRAPDALAVVCGNARLTYRETNSRANQLAHYLRSLGVWPEVTVGICLERSIDMLVALLAVLKSGGAYVPLDPAYPSERLDFMLSCSQVSVLLTQEHLAARGFARRARVVCLERDREAIEKASRLNLGDTAAPDNLAYIIYTSGSTGRPKGAMITHRGLSNYLSWCAAAYPVADGEGSPVHSSISFDLTVTAIFTPLIAGRSVFLLDDDYAVVALNSALKEGIEFSLVKITPSHLEVLSQQLSAERATPRAKALIIGGEQLRYETLGFWRECVPGAKLINEYGPTETVVGCCVYEAPGDAPLSGPVPIGKPIANTQLYVLDDNLRPVPVGVAAELFIGGHGVARGYLNEPDATAARFIPDAFSDIPGARLYRTGDLARYLPDGNIEFLGRADDQVKIRGYRIEPGEIEALLNLYEGVRESVVMAQEGAWEKSRLVAYVTAEKERTLGGSDLRSYLKQKLPEYMVPSSIIVMQEFPLTQNGKIDRTALASLEVRFPEREAVSRAPRTPFEEVLKELFISVLKTEHVGIHDDFFELGGHSLLATRLMIRLREMFRIDMPMRALFESPTVAALAPKVETAVKAGQLAAELPIERVSTEAARPLSFAQQRLWFLDQLEPGSAAYNVFSGFRLKGPLNSGKLEQSLNAVIKRHEILRTTFVTQDGRPVQVTAPELTLTFKADDLREMAKEEREAEIIRLAQQESVIPFDLSAAPLLRTRLLKLSEDEHVLLFTMHHIISDAWSIGILIREVTLLYESLIKEELAPLPSLHYQYGDYANWQQKLFDAGGLKHQLAHWKSQLSGELPVLDLPIDFARPAVQTFAGAREQFHLPAELVASLKSLSRREGATLFMTLLAAFNTLLGRYSAQQDILIGTPIANRSRGEFEGLIGFFVNTLVMRTDLSGNPSFRELIKRVREMSLSAYANQDLPFEEMVEQVRPRRDLSRHPLFQVMFTLQSVTLPEFELPGLSMTPLEVEGQTSQFDLTLEIRDADKELNGLFEYNTSLLTQGRVQRMVSHFKTLLEAIAFDPELRIDEVQILTESERSQLLEGWEAALADADDPACIHNLFEAQAEKNPDAIAVIDEDKQLTYRELDLKSNQLARYLTRLGVGPESIVGILMAQSLETSVALLGVLKAGAAYLAIDPNHPQERSAFVLADAGVKVLVADQRLLASPPAYEAHTVCIDADWEKVSHESEESLKTPVAADNVAYAVFTSGSTGKPKGALVAHRGLVNHAREISDCYELRPGDRVLQFAPLNFDLSAEEIFPTWARGATVVLMRQAKAISIADFNDLLEKQRVTVLNLSASYWHEWMKALLAPPVRIPSALRLIVVGNEAPLAEKFFFWVDHFGHQVRVKNAYGISEATITTTVYDPAGSISARDLSSVPIGRALKNTRVICLDERLQVVPIGVTGELHIGGLGIARGYLNRADLTAERFIPDSFSKQPGARIYKSGDLARHLPDKNFGYMDRKDHQVSVRGFRIELGEIEIVLSTHPMVSRAVAITREERAGDRSIYAFVVADQNGNGTAIHNGHDEAFIRSLREHVRIHLPEYMMPSAFISLETFPRTATGKIDRAALLNLSDHRTELSAAYTAPQTEVEQLIAGFWREALMLEKVGIHDNFFDLGGHSLLLTQVHHRLRGAFSRDISIIEIFQYPTIASLAKYLSQDDDAKRQPLASSQDRATKQRAAISRQKHLAQDGNRIKR